MISKELEERIKNIEQNAQAMMAEINSLRSIDSKLDQLNSIAVDIKNSALNVNERMKQQEKFLEEMKVGADFRKRESENSVREIKTQMHDMEIQGEISLRDTIASVLQAIKDNESFQKEHISKLVEQFNDKFDKVESKIKMYFKFTLFSILLSIIALLVSIMF